MSMRLLAAAAIIGLILGGAGERYPAAPTTVAAAMKGPMRVISFINSPTTTI